MVAQTLVCINFTSFSLVVLLYEKPVVWWAIKGGNWAQPSQGPRHGRINFIKPGCWVRCRHCRQIIQDMNNLLVEQIIQDMNNLLAESR
jgi:hypothetical protein